MPKIGFQTGRAALALVGALVALLLWASPAAAQEPGTLTLAHYAPFSGTVAATAVNVAVDGTPVLTNVVYGQAPVAIPLPAGERLVAVSAALAVTPTVSLTLTVAPGAQVDAWLVGGANGWPLRVIEPDRSPAETAGANRLRVHHFAPLAAGSVSAVDVCLQQPGALPQVRMGNPAFGEAAGADLAGSAAVTLTVAEVSTGCGVVGLAAPSFSLKRAQQADFFFVGTGSGAFPLRLLPAGLAADLSVAHLASTGPVTDTAVSVVVSGSTVLTNVVFGETRGPLPLAGLGVFPLDVMPTGAAAPALTTTLAVTGFFDHLAVITGGAFQPPGVVLLPDLAGAADAQPASQALLATLRVGHFAGLAAAPAATAVDLCTEAGEVVAADLEYGDVRTLTIAPGFARYTVAPAGGSCAAPLLSGLVLPLSAGDEVTLLLGGDNVNAPLTAVTVPPLVETTTWLPHARNEEAPVLPPLPDLLLVQGFDTFHELLRLSGLVDEWRGGGPWALFAPTDAAFAALPAGVLNQYKADPTGKLVELLNGHLVPGRVDFGHLDFGVTLTTTAETTLTFGFDPFGKLLLNGVATVTPPGWWASNGTLFAINKVILPE